jgi:hypothetical protein
MLALDLLDKATILGISAVIGYASYMSGISGGVYRAIVGTKTDMLYERMENMIVRDVSELPYISDLRAVVSSGLGP